MSVGTFWFVDFPEWEEELKVIRTGNVSGEFQDDLTDADYCDHEW